MTNTPVTLRLGDCRTALADLPTGSIDAIVTDPPYELGFMGKRWDTTGVAYDQATWREALRLLKPGGHLLAFGGSRTWHRMAVAIEDAGFETRDSIAWMYGSGFPKSHDVSKAIDKAAGADRPIVATIPDRWAGKGDVLQRATQAERTDAHITAPATDDARRWQGWGTALKPGFEPIVVARKPLAGTVAANVLAHGTGAINIDACRVGATGGTRSIGTPNRLNQVYGDGMGGLPAVPLDAGRWPANVVLSHAPLVDADGDIIGDACADGCVPGCPVADLDGQSGATKSAAPGVLRRGATTGRSIGGDSTYGSSAAQQDAIVGYGDAGGASRFFPAFRYQAKAPGKERPRVNGVAHATVKPLGLMRWMVRLVTPPGGLVADLFAGSGATVEAAMCEGFDVIAVEEFAPHMPLIEFRVERAKSGACC